MEALVPIDREIFDFSNAGRGAGRRHGQVYYTINGPTPRYSVES